MRAARRDDTGPMHSEHAAPAGDEPLTGAYRIVRRVAPPDAPFPARLARRDDDAVVMLVDAKALGEWAGWRASPDGHVLAARDLVRCADGVEIEVDWCTVRLDALLARRGHSAPLLPGEAVTLAVSALRGLGELATMRGRGEKSWPTGSWWMSDSGRPVFVHAPGLGDGLGEPADTGAAALIRSAAAQCADGALRSALSAIADALSEWRTFDIASAETEVFRIADALPIDSDPRPERAAASRDLRPHPMEASADATRGVTAFLSHGVDSSLADLVREALDGLRVRVGHRRRARSDHGRRRAAPWAIAGVVGALVIAGGLLWPAGDGTPPASATPDEPAGPQTSAMTGGSAPPDASSTADTEVGREASSDIASPEGPATDEATDGAAEAGSDLADVAGALLRQRARCGADTTCLAEVVEDPTLELPAGVSDLGPGERTVTLLDEFGGAAVLRVDAKAGSLPSQLVVIVEQDGKWLVRDIHDVAHQQEGELG